MIDKVELRIPSHAFLRPDFRFVWNELRYAGYGSRVQKSRHYQGVVDLRTLGIDALLHLGYRRGDRHDHKLEVLAAGKKTLKQMERIITAAFDVDPGDLSIMRLDLAADMQDVPVSFIHRVLRVRFKRKTDERGELDYEVIGGRRLEYARFGTAPNCLRTYDKTAECKARFREILKHVSKDAEPPTFKTEFGFSEDAVLTRIERQAGGGRVPSELDTFGKLSNAADFDPFTALEIMPDGFVLPDPSRYGAAESVKLLGTQTLIEMLGYHGARAFLNTTGNAGRLLDRYREYLDDTATVRGLTREQIVDTYQKSVAKQITGF